ncbi:MAG: hypothetical protein ABEN55_00720 [Bradymonadaceae bacterium]
MQNQTKSAFEQKAENQVAKWLETLAKEGQWHAGTNQTDGLDLIGKLDDRRVGVVIKATAKPGGPEIEGRLAAAILTGEQHCAEEDILLPIVFAPRIGPNMIEKLEHFVDKHRPNLASGWCI